MTRFDSLAGIVESQFTTYSKKDISIYQDPAGPFLP